MERTVITIYPRTFRIMIVALVMGGMLLWLMSLFIWGGANYRKGAADGWKDQAMSNPSQSYIESGRSFCWSEGNWYAVRLSKGAFKITK